MTRKQFIARLGAVGFNQRNVYIGDNKMWSHNNLRELSYLTVYTNKDFFSFGYNLYTFDELDQFLIDKGIVEKPFDAHEYLIENGYRYSGMDQTGAFFYNPKHLFQIEAWTHIDSLTVRRAGSVVVTIKGKAKQSCDKAIALIESLIKLEKE